MGMNFTHRVSSWIQLIVRQILEIASGLVYLHGEDVNIAHGDLRGVCCSLSRRRLVERS